MRPSNKRRQPAARSAVVSSFGRAPIGADAVTGRVWAPSPEVQVASARSHHRFLIISTPQRLTGCRA
ncbi:MAG: hypothetical protein AUG74_11755 [Bacteroidetes bacterium 13_1_20CM_4_60_6]|nr:MAG: hypothetical protein AUG74_11755 [Bacteroidetes bacterium 13_1_20CM_4_60_6]